MCVYDHLKAICVCAGMLCVHVCEHVYAVSMHVCTCGWKPEDTISCLP